MAFVSEAAADIIHGISRLTVLIAGSA